MAELTDEEAQHLRAVMKGLGMRVEALEDAIRGLHGEIESLNRSIDTLVRKALGEG